MNLKNVLHCRFISVFFIGFLAPVLLFIAISRDDAPWGTDIILKGLPEPIIEQEFRPADSAWDDIHGIVVFVGDIMQHSRQKGGDFFRSYSLLKEELSVADIVIGNLEFPVDESKPVGPLFKSVVFNGDVRHLDALQSAGFNGLSVANNHVFDGGVSGFDNTLSKLQERQLTPIGLAEPRKDDVPLLKPALFDVRGLNVAIFGATYTINIPFDPYPMDFPVVELPFNEEGEDYRHFTQRVLSQSASAARNKGAQALILFSHWGQEWDFDPLPSQLEAAETAFNEGFDLIVGSHSHVIGPIKKVKNNLVVTSLGNFISDFEENEVAVGAMAYAGLDKTGGVQRLGILPLFVVRSDGNGKPLHLVVPLNHRRQEELLKKLTENGIKEGEKLWNSCEHLSRSIFKEYHLKAPPTVLAK